MRYYSATFPRYCTFSVPRDITVHGIRTGYRRICSVLGMDPDKRKSKRSASEQRAVSEYGKFIALIKASKGLRSELWTTAFTVSDLSRGNTVLFVPLLEGNDLIGLDLQKMSNYDMSPWQPPSERAYDRLSLVRSVVMASASNSLNGDYVWRMTSSAYAHRGQDTWLEYTYSWVPIDPQNP